MLPRERRRTLTYSVSIAKNPDSPQLFETDPMVIALEKQAEQCASLGSKMYATLFEELAEDYRWGGRTYAILAGRSDKPIHDATPLRLAGALHRVVLRGDDPRLARHYPSVGGKPGQDFAVDFIGYMRDHLDEIERGLDSQVQTNEVGRSVVPLTVSHWLTTLGIDEYEHLEVGASAGLNLNFDHYYAGVKTLRMGDAASGVRFDGSWFDGMPDVPKTPARVIRRRGVDPFPIDITDDTEQLRLLSFIWPDQRERFERTRAAIEIAKAHPPLIDKGSADTWVSAQLARERHKATVVFHSIVWQYLGRDVQHGLRTALSNAGQSATLDNPLLWVRMEPAGPVADIRATLWNGGEPTEYLLAEISYHGRDMSWHPTLIN